MRMTNQPHHLASCRVRQNHFLVVNKSRFYSLLTTLAGWLALAISAHSANVLLNTNDILGTSSFNATGHWSNGNAPSAGNAYFTTNFILRTPGNTTSYTFGGDSLSVDAGGHMLGKTTGTGQIITVNNLILNGGNLDQATANSDNAIQTWAGNITVNAPSGLGALGGTANGSAGFETLNITAPIKGSADLQVSGPSLNTGQDTGVVKLSAANPYSGVITISGSVIASTVNRLLQLNHLNALSNATLTLSTTTANPLSFAAAVNVGPFNIGGLSGNAGQTLMDTAGAAVTLTVGGNNASSAFSGALSGTGALIKKGTGTLTLASVNTYTGGTTVSGGTLVIGDGLGDRPFSGRLTNNSAVIINVAVKRAFTNIITGNGTLTKSGAGTLALAGSYQGTGPITVQAGTLAVGNDFNLGNAPLNLLAGSFLSVTHNVENQNGFAVGDCRLTNATLNLDLGGRLLNGTTAINVAGTLINDGNTTVNLLNPGRLSVGRFTLLKYVNYQSNALSGFVAMVAPGVVANIENNPANHSLDIVLSTSGPDLGAAIIPNGSVSLTWPAAYQGWTLQCQTNPLNIGLNSNWFDLSNSATTNLYEQPSSPQAPAIFFRLAYSMPVGGLGDPIYENSAYRFYADRMEAWDVYAGIYRSTNVTTITRDGDAAYTWTNALLDKLYLQTPYPILDACYALGVSEMFKVRAPAGTTSAQLAGDAPGGQYYFPYYFMTHGADIREYSRDSAQHIQLGDSVIIDPAGTRGSLIRRCDFSNKLIREDAVQTADNIHFIPAAWEYFKITGDTNLLSTCWSCMSNTIFAKEATYKDVTDGLWTGSPWSDNVSGFITTTEFNNRQTSVKSLYANLMVAMAWRDLGNIAAVLGRTNEAMQYAAKSVASKNSINATLYRPELGTYCYYKYQPTGTNYDYREDMSAGLLNLSDTADAQRCLDYHARFTATPYGYRNVDPVLPAGATSYHGGNVWENEEAYHGWAMARLGKADELMPFIFWHARLGLPQKNWREGTIDPSSGSLHSNYSRMIWSAMGYTSYWSRGIFGISYQLDGIHFSPCVPGSFGPQFYAVLNNFTYRNANLRIILTGCGTNVQQLLLDGVNVNTVPTDLTGNHLIEIQMENVGSPVIPVPRS